MGGASTRCSGAAARTTATSGQPPAGRTREKARARGRGGPDRAGRRCRSPPSGSSPATSAAATPRPPATATRSTCTRSPPKPSASRARSRTACGPRRAAWPRSSSVCPSAFTVTVRFRKPILLPGKVAFGTATTAQAIDFSVTRSAQGDSSSRGPSRAGRRPTKKQERERQVNTAERSMGLGLRALNRLAGSDILDRAGVRKHVERAALSGHPQRLSHDRRRQPHVQRRDQARQTRPPAARQRQRPVRPDARRGAADAPRGRRRLRRRADAPRRARRRQRLRRAQGAARPGHRARAWRCSACPRSSAA